MLVYSNIYLACGAAIVGYTTTLILGLDFSWESLFLPFSNALFVYTINRFTDKNEDLLNVPSRVHFYSKHGDVLLCVSAVLYSTAFIVSLVKGILVFILFVIPLFIGLLYSFARLKRCFIYKNLSVSFAWGSSVFLTAAIHDYYSPSVVLLFLFFVFEFLVNTIIFDVKDIVGDRLNDVATIPSVLGMNITQYISYFLNFTALMIIFCGIGIGILPLYSFILCTLGIYVFIYTYLCNEKRGELYFGLFVDGEFLFLLVCLLCVF